MTIRDEVSKFHLMDHPDERSSIASLSSAFDINWARHRSAYNTTMSTYIVGPHPTMKDAFGFSSELALFLSHHDDVQNRTMQALNSFLQEEPLRGRCDRHVFIFIANNYESIQKVHDYISEFDAPWIPVLLTRQQLDDARNRQWGIRTLIADQLYSRDLFDTQLPVRADSEFFGRDAATFDLCDAVKRGQNRGIFGLRKTGKTSLLFKAQRVLQESKAASCIYIDCKLPKIRKLSAVELLKLIIERILEEEGRKASSYGAYEPYERLERVLQSMARTARVCLIFDEIEYVTPYSQIDTHWKTGFLDFWQTLWSVQSTHGRLCFVVTGVNPYIVEVDTIDGVQNPLFGIVPSSYLRGLERPELGRMINFFANRIGLKFTEEALDILFGEYGGHPLLTRKACSMINRMLSGEHVERPFKVLAGFISDNKRDINSEIEFYFKHVLGELERFYPDEYEMLNYAVGGQEVEFAELAKDNMLTRHLTQYGILRLNEANKPQFLVECLKGYLARETARREGRRYVYRILEGQQRSVWLQNRLTTLVRDFRLLNAEIERATGIRLFSGDTVAKPEEFVRAPNANSESDFRSFLNIMNMLINEQIDQVGKKQKKKDYFFRDVKSTAPDLFDALHRLRVYRNSWHHDVLLPDVETARRKYLVKDLGDDADDLCLDEMQILQQVILDELFLAIQCELSRLSN